jgi:hypothetical protein
MAIGQKPTEPLIALMNADIPKAAARLLLDPTFLSVSSVKISGKNLPPDRAARLGGDLTARSYFRQKLGLLVFPSAAGGLLHRRRWLFLLSLV